MMVIIIIRNRHFSTLMWVDILFSFLLLLISLTLIHLFFWYSPRYHLMLEILRFEMLKFVVEIIAITHQIIWVLLSSDVSKKMKYLASVMFSMTGTTLLTDWMFGECQVHLWKWYWRLTGRKILLRSFLVNVAQLLLIGSKDRERYFWYTFFTKDSEPTHHVTTPSLLLYNYLRKQKGVEEEDGDDVDVVLHNYDGWNPHQMIALRYNFLFSLIGSWLLPQEVFWYLKTWEFPLFCPFFWYQTDTSGL